MDLSELQGLLGQFQPTQEDKDSARRSAMLQLGLGLLGARKGEEFQRLGLSGLNAMNGYQGSLMNAVKERQGNLAQAATLSEMMRKSQFGNELDPGSRPQIGPPTSSGPASSGLAAAPGPMGSPPPAPPAAPQAAPQQSMYQQLINMGVPPLSIKTAAMSSDPPSAVAALIKEYSQPVFGQGKIPMMRGPGNTFTAAPAAGYNDALAAQTGVETGAQEAAKAPYQLQNLNLPGGGTQQVLGDQLQKILRGNNGMPVSAGPAGLAGQTPTPAQQGQDTEVAKGFGQNYLDLVKGEASAPSNIAKYERLKGLYGQIETGKLAPSVMSLKAIAAYVAPDLAKNWTKDVPYAQAASALSNAMALELRNPAGGAGMPGALSDSDRKYLQSMISSIESDPRAIPMLLDGKIAMEQRNRDMGKLARDYKRSNGKIDEGFYQVAQDYADGHPLFPQTSQTPAGPAQTPGQPAVVKTGMYNGRKVVQYSDGRTEYAK